MRYDIQVVKHGPEPILENDLTKEEVAERLDVLENRGNEKIIVTLHEE